MAIAVVPEGSRDRWERLGDAALVLAVVAVLALFVYGMLDAYVF